MSGILDKIIHAVQDFTAKILDALLDKLRIRHAYENNSRLFIIFFSVLLLFIFLIVIFFLIKPDNVSEANSIPLTADITQPFVLPSEPVLLEQYYVSRPKTLKWTEEEADKWFTIPDESMMSQLDNDNNRLIQNLLEASP